jgi:peptide/nickel transport system substrate-binding protein
MIRLVAASTAVLALGLVVLTGASAHGSRGPATASLLNFGIVGPVSTINPGITQTDIGDFVFDFLMRRSPTGQVLPNLAQSVSEPGPGVYIYHLRHGVKFSDGTEMTAEDAASSINYERYPANSDSVQFTAIKSIVPQGRYNLVVTLKHPDAGFKYLFTYAGEVWEKKFQDAHRATFGDPNTLVVATGPYIIQSLSPTQGAELEANPHYWGGAIPIKHISVKFFTDEQSEALAFRAGAIDAAWPNDPKGFAATANTKLLSVPSNQLAYFAMNTKVAPWNDVHVRRAVAYALKRQDLITAAGVQAVPAYTLIPPAMLGELASKAQVDALIKSLPTYQYNLAKAWQELAKSAYPHGFSADFDEFDLHPFLDVAEVVASELSQIGIKLKVNATPIPQWVQQYGSDAGVTLIFSNYDTVTGTDPGFIPRRDFLSNQSKSYGQNWSRFYSASLDALIKAAAAESNRAKRFADYSKFLQVVQSAAPMLPIYLKNQELALDSKFTFPTFNGYLNPTIPWILGVKPK